MRLITPQCGCAMNFSEFLRVERDGREGSKHYVVHTHDPKFTMELIPDGAAPDKIGRGVIKRIHVPNSWAGDYTKYAKFMTAAQQFFSDSFGEPRPKAETRRFTA
jgi:hypothetical protein